MSSTPHSPAAAGSRGNGIPRVIVATTALLTFISFWRAAAIVLNDLASSAYYAGGEAEGYIGKTAPWFILAIMLFSYAVRAVYVESCSMFVRGGVYRAVKMALGGTLALLHLDRPVFRRKVGFNRGGFAHCRHSYLWWQNTKGVAESSEKALHIM